MRFRVARAKSLQGMSGGNSVVESLPSKQMVAGSSPVPRSMTRPESYALGVCLKAGRLDEREALRPAAGQGLSFS